MTNKSLTHKNQDSYQSCATLSLELEVGQPWGNKWFSNDNDISGVINLYEEEYERDIDKFRKSQSNFASRLTESPEKEKDKRSKNKDHGKRNANYLA